MREFDGRVFGSVGDNLMAESASAVNAVECARAIKGAIASVIVTLSESYDEYDRFTYTTRIEGSWPEDPIVIIERR